MNTVVPTPVEDTMTAQSTKPSADRRTQCCACFYSRRTRKSRRCPNLAAPGSDWCARHQYAERVARSRTAAALDALKDETDGDHDHE